MVKNDKHQTRALMNENREELIISEELMHLITNFQNMVHDTAISYHRKLRDSSMQKSQLDKIKGIGEVRKRVLLKTFGSFENIQKTPKEELMKLKGITEDIVNQIKSI